MQNIGQKSHNNNLNSRIRLKQSSKIQSANSLDYNIQYHFFGLATPI